MDEMGRYAARRKELAAIEAAEWAVIERLAAKHGVDFDTKLDEYGSEAEALLDRSVFAALLIRLDVAVSDAVAWVGLPDAVA